MDLPHQWLSPGSNAQLWGNAGTYKAVPYEALPSIAGSLDGSFGWLTSVSSAPYGMSFEHQEDEPIDEYLDDRVAEANRAGLTIPPAFVAFMKDPELHTRIPSCTACYYDLGARLVPLPEHAGPERLLRFMNDQQACYLWYLLLEPNGGHRVVVACPEWKEDSSCDSLDDAADPSEVVVCAASFEEFIKRFWIENTLWAAADRGRTLEGELLAYSDAAKRAVERGLVPR